MRVTNDLLAQYLVNEELIRDLAAEQATIRAMLKQKGSLATDEYVVAVTEQTREYLPGIEVMRDALGKRLINPLIQKSTYNVVRVAKIEKKVRAK